MPFELFAQAQMNPDAFKVGLVIGIIVAVLISAAIPITDFKHRASAEANASHSLDFYDGRVDEFRHR